MRNALAFLAILTLLLQKIHSVFIHIFIFSLLSIVVFFNLGVLQQLPGWKLVLLHGANFSVKKQAVSEAVLSGHSGLAKKIAQNDKELLYIANSFARLNSEERWWESLRVIQPGAAPVLRSLAELYRSKGNDSQANELLQRAEWLKPFRHVSK